MVDYIKHFVKSHFKGVTTKVIGVHCYLGGFLIGLQQAGLEVVTSLESWKPGLNGAQTLGLPSSEMAKKRARLQADLVVGNPPCSRFSHLSLSFFKKSAHEDINTFPEVLELIEVAKTTKAKTIWWETGPLAWSLGKPLLRNLHDFICSIWGETTTLLVRLDLRSIGIPQRRPRIHVIHTRTKFPPPSVPSTTWPTNYTVGEWLTTKLNGYKLQYPVFQKNSNNPVAWAHKRASEMTFRSMVPKIISHKDWYTGSIVSRRLMIWQEKNRWFDLLEHAALMTYPLKRIPKLLSVKKRPLDAQVLISKSVAPAASKWVAENVILPWLNQDSREEEIKPVLREKDIWELDLAIPQRVDRKLLSGQLPLSANQRGTF